MEDDRQPQSAVSWVRTHSKHKPNVKYVLAMLASCIDDGNTCPSHKDLAEMTGYTKKTVQHILGELEKDGTITRLKNGGVKVQGGRKTCYRIVQQPEVSTSKETTPEEGTSKEGTSEVPSSKVDTYQVGTSTVNVKLIAVTSHARAAGEKELLKESVKEQKEIVIQQQTNSLNSPVEARAGTKKSGPVIGPAASAIVPETVDGLNISSTKSPVPSSDPQPVSASVEASTSSPSPNVPPEPPPPPPELLKLYFDTFAYDATLKEQAAVRWILDTYGMDFVKQQVSGAKLVDAANKAIHNPMCYARVTLEGERAKSQAAAHSQKFVARSHRQNDNRQSDIEASDDRPFTSPPPKTANTPKGVLAWQHR